jgi:AcrR family transcriptional regulator
MEEIRPFRKQAKGGARRDAARNRQAVLKAATAVFGEHGGDASLDLVAQRAGVGRATLYRNFTDREALLTALFEEDLDHLEEMERRAEAKQSFLGLLEQFEEIVAARPMLGAAIAHKYIGTNQQHLIRAKLRRIFEPAFTRARLAGELNPKLDDGDLLLILRLVFMTVVDRGSPVPESERTRFRELILNGILK